MTKKKVAKERIVKRVKTMMNVRSNPSFQSLVIKILQEGTILEVDPNFDNPEWDRIPEGYVCKEFLEELPSTTVVKKDPIIIQPLCDAAQSAKGGKK